MSAASAMTAETTLMAREAAEAPAAVAILLAANDMALRRIAARLRANPPTGVVTCARGSSDHAATYAKYLVETRIGAPTASAALSVASLYDAPVAAGNRLCIVISQSGRSPDLLRAVERQRQSGAFVVALVNQDDAPVCALADEVIALSAGQERSVAATKSYICSLAAIAALVARWSEDAAMLSAVEALPALLADASRLDWSPAIDQLRDAANLFVIGRGYGLAVAQEAALKFKETCALHAECFSAAEVKHGPMAIVQPGFHILAFGGGDQAGADVRATADMFRARGAKVLLADPSAGHEVLPMIAAHPAIEPIAAIQSFYPMANALAVARGCDPDAPPHLEKVTRTV